MEKYLHSEKPYTASESIHLYVFVEVATTLKETLNLIDSVLIYDIHSCRHCQYNHIIKYKR